MVVASAFRLRTALLVGGGLSAIRLALLWGGITLTAEYADWRQVAGYVVLMLNSIVEIGIASRHESFAGLGALAATGHGQGR